MLNPLKILEKLSLGGLQGDHCYPVRGCMGMVQSCTRGFRLDMKKHFATKRLVKHWKRLPGQVVDHPSLSVFKRHLDNVIYNLL